MDKKKVISMIRKGQDLFLMTQTDGKKIPVTLETDGSEIWFTRDAGVVKYSTGFSYKCYLSSPKNIGVPESEGSEKASA